MHDSEPDAIAPTSHLGFRIAVGVVGLALIALFVMLGSVAMKQSATSQALESRESLGEDAPSAPGPE
jgi:NAD/NADP transhydrogenase alpha subunit